MQVKVGLQQTLLELLSSSSAPRRRSWGTGGREATTGAPQEAGTAPGVIITTMNMITTNMIITSMIIDHTDALNPHHHHDDDCDRADLVAGHRVPLDLPPPTCTADRQTHPCQR